jgi:hypothetical protein
VSAVQQSPALLPFAAAVPATLHELLPGSVARLAEHRNPRSPLHTPYLCSCHVYSQCILIFASAS